MFNETVITKKGIALNNKVQAGSVTIEYLRVGLGNGVYEKAENLEEKERLKVEKQSVPISSIKIIDENTVRLRVVINNEGITEGYDITEIGLYATDPDEGEILYSIATAMEDKEDYQPSEAEVADYQITIDLYSTVSNASNAIIKLDMGAVASAEDLMQLKEDISKGDISETIIVFESAADREALDTNEKTTVLLGKISKWLSDLKDAAFSGKAVDLTQDASNRFVSDTEKTAWNGKVTASGGDISATKITSLDTISTEFPEPAAGESAKTFLGKVKKFISDFNAIKNTLLTISSLVNNGQTTASGLALDARYGKTLYDLLASHTNELRQQNLAR